MKNLKKQHKIDLVVLNNLRFLGILIAAFFIQLLNVKVEKFEKTRKKGNNSYMVSRIVTKIAQQIDLVVLNNLRCHGILISALVFELFAKTAGLPLCSIISNGSHVFDSANKPGTIYNLDTL